MPDPANQAIARRLAQLGASDARAIAKMARNNVERCKLLCDGYTANAAALSLDPTTDPTVIEPKDIIP